MQKKHFEPYIKLIKKSINSCTTIDEVHCCRDMIYRFKEQFSLVIMAPADLDDALTELHSEVNQKAMEVN